MLCNSMARPGPAETEAGRNLRCAPIFSERQAVENANNDSVFYEFPGCTVFKLLLALTAFLYAAFVFLGEDRGQIRNGLVPVATVEPAQDVPDAARPVLIIAAESPAPPTPRQPIRVLPRPDTVPLPVVARREAAAPEPMPERAAEPMNLRWITANTANVRANASRNSALTGKAGRGQEVLVLWQEPNGWVRIRVEGDGLDGFVHQSLLSESPPRTE
jgi:hypothetical protein